ncbi:hypothetical protein KIPB_016715, partial [Kipferlia bialata]|eukprot:g16715.t1
MVNRCLGPKERRVSAYHMAAAGLFQTSVRDATPSAAALARVQRLLATVWQQVQLLRGQAETVPCNPASLLTHFTPGEECSTNGYCRLEVASTDGEEEESPLMVLVRALQLPILIGGEQIALLEADGEGVYQLFPSIDACTVMQQARQEGDTETLHTLQAYYAALGRFLAFQLLEGPLPHGLF